jgi:hypothetical protein
LGRLKTICSCHAIALNESYHQNSFMNLLNRSKTMVQDTDLSFKDGQSVGAGI